MNKNISKVVDEAAGIVGDFVDKVSSPTSRSGHTVSRIVAMYDAGVSERTIASQLTDSSSKKFKYSVVHVRAFVALYSDCKTKPPITSSVANSLIKDQIKVGSKLCGEPF